MRTRRLSLQKETLTTLSGDDLTLVAAAAIPTTPVQHCIDTNRVCLPDIEQSVLPCNTRPCTS